MKIKELKTSLQKINEELSFKYDESKLIDSIVTIVIQVNGKVRGKIEVEKDTSKEEIEKLAKNIENVKTYIDGKEILKLIVVPNKLVSIVVK